MLRSLGWVANVILVSALGPNPSFYLFWRTYIQLGGLFDRGLDLAQGLTIRKAKNAEKLRQTYTALR